MMDQNNAISDLLCCSLVTRYRYANNLSPKSLSTNETGVLKHWKSSVYRKQGDPWLIVYAQSPRQVNAGLLVHFISSLLSVLSHQFCGIVDGLRTQNLCVSYNFWFTWSISWTRTEHVPRDSIKALRNTACCLKIWMESELAFKWKLVLVSMVSSTTRGWRTSERNVVISTDK